MLFCFSATYPTTGSRESAVPVCGGDRGSARLLVPHLTHHTHPLLREEEQRRTVLRSVLDVRYHIASSNPPQSSILDRAFNCLLIVLSLYINIVARLFFWLLVDEKERKAGHNPEEEMKQYGHVDYNRP